MISHIRGFVSDTTTRTTIDSVNIIIINPEEELDKIVERSVELEEEEEEEEENEEDDNKTLRTEEENQRTENCTKCSDCFFQIFEIIIQIFSAVTKK